MVEEHSEVFENAKYAIGEFGGFTNYIAGKPFYPIMIAEKQKVVVRVTFTGAAGHGSMPIKGGAMSQLGTALTKLDIMKTLMIIDATMNAATPEVVEASMNPLAFIAILAAGLYSFKVMADGIKRRANK